MVIRPIIDDYGHAQGTEIIKFDTTKERSPFKTQKIIERSCKFYGNNYLSKKQKQVESLVLIANLRYYSLPYSQLIFSNTF